MRKRYFFIVLLLSLCLIIKVEALECSGSTLANLQKEANNIKVNHEIVKETVTKHLYDYFDNELPETVNMEKKSIKLNIYNLTKNVFVIQTEKNYQTYDNEVVLYGEAKTPLKYTNEKTINYKDTNNGNYSWIVDNLDHYIDYKFEIYSNTDCDTTLLKTITYRKPKFNKYSQDSICLEYSNVNLCQEFISNDLNLNNKSFVDEVKRLGSSGEIVDNNEEDNSTESKKVIGKEKIYIISSGLVVVLIIVGYLVIDKRRSRI